MLLYLRCRDGGADRGARVGTRGPSQGLGPTTLQIGMPRGSVSHESFVSAYNSHALAFIPFPFFSRPLPWPHLLTQSVDLARR